MQYKTISRIITKTIRNFIPFAILPSIYRFHIKYNMMQATGRPIGCIRTDSPTLPVKSKNRLLVMPQPGQGIPVSTTIGQKA